MWFIVFKKKGYTLIELIVVIGILAIISGIISLNVMKIKEIVNRVALEDSVSEVRGLLSFGKSYCRRNRVNGKFIIDSNKMYFIVQEFQYKINKSTEEKIGLSLGKDNMELKVDKEGYITTGNTIVIGYKGKHKEVKIAVGNDSTREVDIIDWRKKEAL